MDISQGKVFHKPEMGTYFATIIDVVEKPQVQTQWGLKDKVRIDWALISTTTMQVPLGPDGEPVFGSVFTGAVMNPKSKQPLYWNLWAIVNRVLGTTPPLITKFSELESILLGRSNAIMLTKEDNPNKPGDFYSNVVGIMPLPPGAPIATAPVNFKRDKDRQQKPQQVSPAQYVQPASVAQVAAVAAPAQQPPTPEQVAAWIASQQQQPVKNNSSF
jgi:hypothetical protein